MRFQKAIFAALMVCGALFVTGHRADAAVTKIGDYGCAGTMNVGTLSCVETTTPSVNQLQVADVTANQGVTVTPPTPGGGGSWTLACNSTNTSNGIIYVYYRLWQTGDSPTVTFTFASGTGNYSSIVLKVYSGNGTQSGVVDNCNAFYWSNTANPSFGSTWATTAGALGAAAVVSNNTGITYSAFNGSWIQSDNLNTPAHNTLMAADFSGLPIQPAFTYLTYTGSASSPQAGIVYSIESGTPAFQTVITKTAQQHWWQVCGMNIRPDQGYPTNYGALAAAIGVCRWHGLGTQDTLAQMQIAAATASTYGQVWDIGVNSCDTDTTIINALSMAKSLNIPVLEINPPNEMDAASQNPPNVTNYAACGGSLGTYQYWYNWMESRWNQVVADAQTVYPLIVANGPSLVSSSSFCTLTQYSGSNTQCSNNNPVPWAANNILATNGVIHPYPAGGYQPIRQRTGTLAYNGCDYSQTYNWAPSMWAYQFPGASLGCSGAQTNLGPWTSTTNGLIGQEWSYCSATNSSSCNSDITVRKYGLRNFEDHFNQGYTEDDYFQLFTGAGGFICNGTYMQTGSACNGHDSDGITPNNPLRIYSGIGQMINMYYSAGIVPFTSATIQININGNITIPSVSSATPQGTIQGIYPNTVQGSIGEFITEVHLEAQSEVPNSFTPTAVTPQNVEVTWPGGYTLSNVQLCSISQGYNETTTCTAQTVFVNSIGAQAVDFAVPDDVTYLTYYIAQFPGATGTGGTGYAVGNGPNLAAGGAIGNGQY